MRTRLKPGGSAPLQGVPTVAIPNLPCTLSDGKKTCVKKTLYVKNMYELKMLYCATNALKYIKTLNFEKPINGLAPELFFF